MHVIILWIVIFVIIIIVINDTKFSNAKCTFVIKCKKQLPTIRGTIHVRYPLMMVALTHYILCRSIACGPSRQQDSGW